MSILKTQLLSKVSSQSSVLSNQLLLLLWIIIGALLRFINLTSKPPWTDEFATMAFSIGNTFDQIPLNQRISSEQLLRPLVLNSQIDVHHVIQLILDKDNHPPFYFILCHFWIQLFSRTGDYVSLWGMRSLPALFGVLSIPLIYWIGTTVFNSTRIGQYSAGMMAVSPYGIFIAQEARHYTLAILFVLASLACFITAFALLFQQKKLPYSLIFSWILINSFGISTHYFLSLILVGQGLSLAALLIHQIRNNTLKYITWIRLLWVIFGTAVTGLMWLSLSLSRGYGNEMTAWIQRHDYPILGMINPPFQLLAAWITMFTLLPVESGNLAVVILSGLVMLIFFIWLIPLLKKGIQVSLVNPTIQIETQALLIFIGSLLIITFTITYGFGIDITRGARYSFIYFPPILLLLGVILDTIAHHSYFQSSRLIPEKCLRYLSRITSKQPQLTVALIWLMGLLGAITVLVNLGYQKYYLPNRLIKVIEQKTTAPVLVVAPYISLSQTGEIMGIAWEAVHQQKDLDLSFIILQEENTKIYHLPPFLEKENNPNLYPLEIWPVNFYYSSLKLKKNCQIDSDKMPSINGYNYQRFYCSSD